MIHSLLISSPNKQYRRVLKPLEEAESGGSPVITCQCVLLQYLEVYYGPSLSSLEILYR